MILNEMKIWFFFLYIGILYFLGEQMIVVCKSTLQIWALQTDEVESRSNRVSFDIGMGDGTTGSNKKTWKNIWHYK